MQLVRSYSSQFRIKKTSSKIQIGRKIPAKKYPNGGFFYFYVLYSSLLHLPPLIFHCVGKYCMGSNPGMLRLLYSQSDALPHSLISATHAPDQMSSRLDQISSTQAIDHMSSTLGQMSSTTPLDIIHSSARSHHSRLDLIHIQAGSQLDLIHTRLDLILKARSHSKTSYKHIQFLNVQSVYQLTKFAKFAVYDSL